MIVSRSLTQEIKQKALAVGFDAVGISAVPQVRPHEPVAAPDAFLPRLLARLQQWLGQEFHATMSWMACDPDRRANPSRVLPGCRSIISVGINYYTDHRATERAGEGRIARYAWGRDYHELVGQRLQELEGYIRAIAPHEVTRSYVDTGPIMEKAWAERSGLGWIGKHSNLVSPQFGSWLLLGEVLTTLELSADEPGTDLCGSCTLCIKACPTGAITEPYIVDASRCISYLTIELRDAGSIPDDLARNLGNRIFGCDDCLDVCPYNVNAQESHEAAFQPHDMTLSPELDRLEAFTAAEFASAFRHSPVRRSKFSGFQRNVSLAQVNTRAHRK